MAGPSDQDRTYCFVAPRTNGGLSHFTVAHYVYNYFKQLLLQICPSGQPSSNRPASVSKERGGSARVDFEQYIERGLRAVRGDHRDGSGCSLVATSGDHSLEKWKWQKMLSFSNVVSACPTCAAVSELRRSISFEPSTCFNLRLIADKAASDPAAFASSWDGSRIRGRALQEYRKAFRAESRARRSRPPRWLPAVALARVRVRRRGSFASCGRWLPP